MREQSFGVQCFQFQPAQIIVSAFQVCRADRPSEDGFEQRNVFVENLILKRFGAGGDQNAPAMQQRGQQVGDGFSGPGPGFDDDVVLDLQAPDTPLPPCGSVTAGIRSRPAVVPALRPGRKTRSSPAKCILSCATL